MSGEPKLWIWPSDPTSPTAAIIHQSYLSPVHLCLSYLTLQALLAFTSVLAGSACSWSALDRVSLSVPFWPLSGLLAWSCVACTKAMPACSPKARAYLINHDPRMPIRHPHLDTRSMPKYPSVRWQALQRRTEYTKTRHQIIRGLPSLSIKSSPQSHPSKNGRSSSSSTSAASPAGSSPCVPFDW